MTGKAIPGKNNSLADIAGLKIGNAQDDSLKSGATAIICDEPMIASVAVHGGAPGTRDVALLEPENSVESIDAITLSGGSAFGLDAASGVQSWLRQNGRGFAIGSVRIPIVPGAIIFDLINGGDKDWGKHSPYRDFGWDAAENASSEFATGSVGAGTGAITAGLKGGLGSASIVLENGVTIAALFAVNCLGSCTFGETKHFHAAMFEHGEEFGGHGAPDHLPADASDIKIKFREVTANMANTTIGVVATDAVLTKAQAKRLAIAAHDGIARAIWPAHTPMDGDLVFALASGKSGVVPGAGDWIDLGAHAAGVTARAIAQGVYTATGTAGDPYPSYQEKFQK